MNFETCVPKMQTRIKNLPLSLLLALAASATSRSAFETSPSALQSLPHSCASKLSLPTTALASSALQRVGSFGESIATLKKTGPLPSFAFPLSLSL